MATALGIAVVVVVIAGGSALLFRRHAAPASAPQKRIVAAATVPQATAHLGINAFPWAEVRSVRNVFSGREIELKSPLVTPAPLDLAPGKYEITFSNPSFSDPIVRTVEVRAGEERIVRAEFTRSANASLPRFEGGSR